MYAAKLTLAASTGIPLTRWGNRLTILLEKVFGNIFIDKTRVIFLLGANYNWLNIRNPLMDWFELETQTL
jgi:hypothetical protein